MRASWKTRLAAVLALLVCLGGMPARAEDADALEARFLAAEKQFPANTYYNGVDEDGVFLPDAFSLAPCTPAMHETGQCVSFYRGGTQCMAFASRLSVWLFGSAPTDHGALYISPSTNRDGWTYIEGESAVDLLAPGDVVRIRISGQGGEHSLVIREAGAGGFRCAEANYNDDCRISYNRVMTREEMRGAILYAYQHPGGDGHARMDDEQAFNLQNLFTGVASDGAAVTGGLWTGRAILPDTIGGMPLTELQCAFAYATCLEEIVLPASVARIDDASFRMADALKRISVAPGNQHFKVVDGVLFSMDGTRLIGFPAGLAIETYAVPEGVTDVNLSSLWGCADLREVYLPASVERLAGLGETMPAGLERIEVDEDNAFFRSVGGVLYTRSASTLLACPAGLTGSIELPRGVAAVADGAFRGSALSEVILPDTLLSLGEDAFSGAKIRYMILPSGLVTVGRGAFQSCPELRTLILPAGLAYVPAYFCASCPHLRSLAVQDAATVFAAAETDDNDAVFDCANLTVYAPVGSFAQAYCVARGIPWAVLE